MGILDWARSLFTTACYSTACLVSLAVLALYMKQDNLLYHPTIQNMPKR